MINGVSICTCIYISCFSMKTYIMGTHKNRLGEANLMRIVIGIRGEISKYLYFSDRDHLLNCRSMSFISQKPK